MCLRPYNYTLGLEFILREKEEHISPLISPLKKLS